MNIAIKLLCQFVIMVFLLFAICVIGMSEEAVEIICTLAGVSIEDCE